MRDVVEIARDRQRQLKVEIARYDEFLRVAESLCAHYVADERWNSTSLRGHHPNAHPHPNGETAGVGPAVPSVPVKGG